MGKGFGGSKAACCTICSPSQISVSQPLSILITTAAARKPMKYGVIIFPIEDAIPLSQLAVAAEERGFEALFVPEHTHIPTSRRSPYIGGGEIPPEYLRIPDPFIALAGAAAASNTIKLGTAVCLVVEHDPIVLAKQVATLDRLCGGRFIFGVGAGWNAEEMANHGTDFKTRWKLLRERVAAMKVIWSQDQAEYHGDLVNFDPIWSYPKPLQKPHPPIFLGGHKAASLRRVVDYCEGWMPVLHLMPDFIGTLTELRARAEEAGRDPATIKTIVMGAPRDRAGLDRLEAAGVDCAVFHLRPAPADVVLYSLDRCVQLMRR
jgi:probable F420-dependent oxidoreductase